MLVQWLQNHADWNTNLTKLAKIAHLFGCMINAAQKKEREKGEVCCWRQHFLI